MMWSTLLCAPSPWLASADMDRKSVGRADMTDTLKEIRVSATSARPTLLTLGRHSYFIFLDTTLFVSLPGWEASVTYSNRHSIKTEYNTIDICSISQATSLFSYKTSIQVQVLI
jgi:hypothetical protein